jgi:hypothetical protein
MPRKLAAPGTASGFIVETLSKYSDREMRIGDIYELGQGRFQKPNLVNALDRLLAVGTVVRFKDGREAWWAIA